MSERVQEQRSKHVRKQEQETAPAPAGGQAQQLKNDLDAVLDEIDEVLEENAEEFVKSYVQKGGE